MVSLSLSVEGMKEGNKARPHAPAAGEQGTSVQEAGGLHARTSELASDHRTCIEVVAASALAQCIQVDMPRRVAREGHRPTLVEQRREAQFEGGVGAGR